MALKYHTISKTIELGSDNSIRISETFKGIDQESNIFWADKHWTQARDTLQLMEYLGGNLVISRTFVYSDEQAGFGPPAGMNLPTSKPSTAVR